MNRWTNKRALRKLRRGVTAFFVCLIVALPLILTAWQWSKIAIGDTSRRATGLPAMHQRAPDADKTPELFKEPLISVTFDDGWESIYTSAMPDLQRYGIHTTQYVLTGTEKYPGYMSWPQIQEVQKSGHEIACHSVDHPDLTTLEDSDLQKQLAGCKSDMLKHLGPVTEFASPYGSYNDRTISAIKKEYRSQRNINGVIADGISDSDINLSTNFDRYNIIGVTVRRETTVEQLKQLVDYAKARNGWLVLTYHQADDGPSQYGIDSQALQKQLAYLSATDLKIVTVGQVMNSLNTSARGN